MAIIKKDRRIIETPTGRGKVYQGLTLIAVVDYDLQVFPNLVNAPNSGDPFITGIIRRVDGAGVRWSPELMTLQLQDKRKLDFICVNYDPECEITSSSGFYT